MITHASVKKFHQFNHANPRHLAIKPTYTHAPLPCAPVGHSANVADYFSSLEETLLRRSLTGGVQKTNPTMTSSVNPEGVLNQNVEPNPSERGQSFTQLRPVGVAGDNTPLEEPQADRSIEMTDVSAGTWPPTDPLQLLSEDERELILQYREDKSQHLVPRSRAAFTNEPESAVQGAKRTFGMAFGNQGSPESLSAGIESDFKSIRCPSKALACAMQVNDELPIGVCAGNSSEVPIQPRVFINLGQSDKFHIGISFSISRGELQVGQVTWGLDDYSNARWSLKNVSIENVRDNPLNLGINHRQVLTRCMENDEASGQKIVSKRLTCITLDVNRSTTRYHKAAVLWRVEDKEDDLSFRRLFQDSKAYRIRLWVMIPIQELWLERRCFQVIRDFLSHRVSPLSCIVDVKGRTLSEIEHYDLAPPKRRRPAQGKTENIQASSSRREKHTTDSDNDAEPTVSPASAMSPYNRLTRPRSSSKSGMQQESLNYGTVSSTDPPKEQAADPTSPKDERMDVDKAVTKEKRVKKPALEDEDIDDYLGFDDENLNYSFAFGSMK